MLYMLFEQYHPSGIIICLNTHTVNNYKSGKIAKNDMKYLRKSYPDSIEDTEKDLQYFHDVLPYRCQ